MPRVLLRFEKITITCRQKKMKQYKHYACKKCGEFIVNNRQRLRIQFKCLVSNNDYRSTTVSQYSYIQALDEYLAFNDG